ncbi:MAG: hypothetical protein HZB53_14100 [Chloroflexi bacterium]|nr:hypothetical protein [Chloroflexota bacterium]
MSNRHRRKGTRAERPAATWPVLRIAVFCLGLFLALHLAPAAPVQGAGSTVTPRASLAPVAPSATATATPKATSTQSPAFTATMSGVPTMATRTATLPASPSTTTTPTAIPTITPTATSTALPTATPSATAVYTTTPALATPIITVTVLPATATATPTATVLPTAKPTATPAVVQNLPPLILPMAAVASTGLWGTTQTVSGCTQVNAANSVDSAFNNAVSQCNGAFGSGNWTYTAIQDTAYTTIVAATLDFRFYMTRSVGYNDSIALQVSNNNGSNYTTITTYNTTTLPPSALTTQSFNVSAYFGTPTQVNNARVRLLGTVNGSAESVWIYVDEAMLTVYNTLPPQPTPTAQPAQPTKAPLTGDPHPSHSAISDDCAACHRPHTATGIELRKVSPEETLCFGCHKSGGTGTNVQPAFTLYTNTTTRIFKHDVAATNGIHQPDQSTGTSYTGANRHIECEDCHEPHRATRDATTGSTKAPNTQRVMNGADGVDPVWTSTGPPFTFNWLPAADREYQVCLKCHSSFTTLPTYQPDGWSGTTYVANGLTKITAITTTQVLDSRDLAKQFNPNNASYHPVVAQGKNSTAPAGGFVTGYSATSIIYCTDCHTNADTMQGANGPHGSPRLHLLTGTANYTTRDRANVNGEVCFKCHQYTTYANGSSTQANTRFHSGSTNYHTFHVTSESSSCYTCHNSHGSDQSHLINFDTSVVRPTSGYTSQTAWVNNGSTAYCMITCHGQTHDSGKSYTP